MAPGEAAHALGVSIETVRRWIEDGKLTEHRTAGGHRRVDSDEVAALLGVAPPKPARRPPRKPKGIVGYARAHPAPNREAVIAAQQAQLRRYGCDEVLVEVASAHAERRPALAEILGWVAAREVGEVVVVSQDRLGAGMADLVSQVLASLGARLVVLEPAMSDTSTRDELEAELRSVVAAYATRLFGPGDKRITNLMRAIDKGLA